MMKKIILLAVLAVGSILLLAGCGKTKMDLKEYLDVEFEGVSGKGTAIVTFDSEEFEDDLRDTKVGGELSKKKRQRFVESFEVKVKESEDLSNGDKVVVTLDYDKKDAKEYGFEFANVKTEYTVEDLKELKEVDAFQYMDVTVEGVSPNITLDLDNNSDEDVMEDFYFYVDEDRYNFKIGDKVKIKVSYSEYDLEEAGYMVKEETTEYEIKEGDAYITKYEQITDEGLTQMKQLAEAEIQEAFADRYQYTSLMNNTVQAVANTYYPYNFDLASVQKTELVLSKAYVFVNKDLGDNYFYGTKNAVLLMYEVSVADSVVTSPTKIYIPVFVTDVVLGKDGKITVEEDQVAYSKNAVSSVWDDVYKAVVTENEDEFDVEEHTY